MSISRRTANEKYTPRIDDAAAPEDATVPEYRRPGDSPSNAGTGMCAIRGVGSYFVWTVTFASAVCSRVSFRVSNR